MEKKSLVDYLFTGLVAVLIFALSFLVASVPVAGGLLAPLAVAGVAGIGPLRSVRWRLLLSIVGIVLGIVGSQLLYLNSTEQTYKEADAMTQLLFRWGWYGIAASIGVGLLIVWLRNWRQQRAA